MKYIIAIRGVPPPDLAKRITEAHAIANQKKPTNAVIAPVGERGKPDATGQPH